MTRFLVVMMLLAAGPGALAEEAEAPEPVEDVGPGRRALAGLAAGGAACLVGPAVGAVTVVIPVVGVLCAPVVIGSGMGFAGWAAGSFAGKKRIPIVPLVVGGVVGGVLTTLAAIPAYLMSLAASAVILYTGTIYLDVLAVYAAGAFIFYFVLLFGVVATAVAIGVLAALLGRGLARGESPWGWDLLAVPPPSTTTSAEPPAEAPSDENDDWEYEDAEVTE